MKIPDLNYKSKKIIPRLVKLTDAMELFLTDADYTQNKETAQRLREQKSGSSGSVLVESAEGFQREPVQRTQGGGFD